MVVLGSFLGWLGGREGSKSLKIGVRKFMDGPLGLWMNMHMNEFTTMVAMNITVECQCLFAHAKNGFLGVAIKFSTLPR